MRNSKLLHVILASAILIKLALLNSGCTSSVSGQPALSKEDSIAIAAAILNGNVRMKDTICNQGVTFTEERLVKRLTRPISWNIVDSFKKGYDAAPVLWMPVIKGENQKFYTGFKIDKQGLDFLRNTSAKYDEVYIRLGRDSGTKKYTFLIMPMRGGKLAQNGVSRNGQDENLDHLDPCPGPGCPTDFDN